MGYEMAKAMANVAIASSHKGDSATALDLFRDARDLFEQEHNHAWTAIVDLYQALVFFQDGRLEEAEGLCRARAPLLRRISAHRQGRAVPVAAGPHPPERRPSARCAA